MKLVNVFLDVEADDELLGRIVIELRADLVPKTSEIFVPCVQVKRALGSRAVRFTGSSRTSCFRAAILPIITGRVAGRSTAANLTMRISRSATRNRGLCQWQMRALTRMARNSLSPRPKLPGLTASMWSLEQ